MTLDLDALEMLAAEATPGPWEATVYVDDEEKLDAQRWHSVEADDDDIIFMSRPAIVGMSQPDAAFIAASRYAIPALVAEVRHERSEARDLAGEVARWRDLAEKAADALVAWGESESCDEGDEARAIYAALEDSE